MRQERKMVTEQLQKKIDNSIRLLQSVAKGYDGEIEVAYSGGKDSDVILQLAKESGIRFRAIYKNTTIDPPGTISHVKEMGVEILRPKKSFFKLIQENGYPNMFMRFCCRILKEYKVLDKAIIGVRKSESVKRKNRYTEPTECKFYGSKKEHVEAIYPILDWTDDDVKEFILDRGIKLAPIYYDRGGQFVVTQRLGCMCCPLKSTKKRIASFKEHPKMVRAYIRNNRIFRKNHPNVKSVQMYASSEEQFVRDVFYDSQKAFLDDKNGVFGPPDYRKFLEEQFGIDLSEK